jgi:aryl-alcohol dehydrogenase-like predicted oxidoreductase
MDRVPLGRSGLVTSVIGLGGGSSGRFGLVKGGMKADALRLIRTALDEGITFFDGAGICGGVDELLAEGLGKRRKDVILSTKIHLGPDPLPFTRSRLANQASSWAARRYGLVGSGPTMRKRIEQGLRALRTDRIDVLHLHAVSPRQYPLAVAKVVPELSKMKDEGKIGAIGVTESFLRDPSHRMLREALGDGRFDTIMVGFNIRDPGAAKDILPAADNAGAGVIGMFAMRGLLDGPATDDLVSLAREAGVSGLAELAYRYCRHQPGISVVLTGTGDPAHLRQNIAAANAPPLPQSVLDRLRAFSDR